MFYWLVQQTYRDADASGNPLTETGRLLLQEVHSNNRFVAIADAYEGLFLLAEDGGLYRYSLDAMDYEYLSVLKFSGNETESFVTETRPKDIGDIEKINIPNFYNSLDSNSDGLSDLIERYLGLNPQSNDTNADGLKDSDAVRLGLSASSWDNDGDTIPNAIEIARGLNPNSTDSDGDGMLDHEEFYLYDRLSNYILTTDPNSQGPAINLISPANATAL
jgi:hypothetical protein